MTGSPAILTPEELVNVIKGTLDAQPYRPDYHHYKLAPPEIKPALYSLVVGAGFSYRRDHEDDAGVPLVDELMKVTIGDYYYPDQDQSSMKRGIDVLRRHSADFWEEFNEAAAGAGLPSVALDRKGLPADPGAAYQYLFTYEGANVLFRLVPGDPGTEGQLMPYLSALRREEKREQGQDRGEQFVKGFLRYVLSPGAEHGYGITGRHALNRAHIYLAALLEAQQVGNYWKTRAFCRTILTTNFDPLLQNGLQMVNLLYRLTDRPERGLDRSDFFGEEGPVHLVYVHGSILRYNPASSVDELGTLEKANAAVLREFLESRDVIVIGYSGWKDGLMTALRGCDHAKHQVYWCGVDPQPADHIKSFLEECGDRGTYVNLGGQGADGLMCLLYETLVPEQARRNPMERYWAWNRLMGGEQPMSAL